LQYYVPFSAYVISPTTPPQSTWSYNVKAGKAYVSCAEATHLIRASAGNYTLVVEPDLFTIRQDGTHDIAISPWAPECTWNHTIRRYQACAFYTTGFDAVITGNAIYWCLPDGTPCPRAMMHAQSNSVFCSLVKHFALVTTALALILASPAGSLAPSSALAIGRRRRPSFDGLWRAGDPGHRRCLTISGLLRRLVPSAEFLGF
jgi:hypothetical protein